MHSFQINPSPLMTRHLVEETEIFARDPFIFVDIGAHSGFPVEWTVFAPRARLYCFEPNEAECKRLSASAPPNVTYIPKAIGAKTGVQTLYEAKLPYSTGLYKGNMAFYGRFLGRDNLRVIAEHAITVYALDEALAPYGVKAVDFLKIDVEGAELEILAASTLAGPASALLGLQTEIRFHKESNGSPSFATVDAALAERNFRLYNLQFNHQSRHGLPYPGTMDYRLPSGERFFAYSTYGQILDGDGLYFRDLLLPGCQALLETLSPICLLKLCALFEVYSLSDCAAELIEAARPRLATVTDCDRLLDLLASGMLGRPISHRDYRAAFDHDPTLRSAGPETQEIAEHGRETVRSGLKLGRALLRLVTGKA
jgi:FkbM family methyltransferase